ncbi:unnamed protein product [Caenorhabditis auriculariae]|uniref:t-SNARE coiled-coil homology domain-containing protein n=1 Tax=Caenorhabditis auriculariae TaxID=2777116 RepID=A0A8S1GXL0_9PELO|nr:unnamed protein product [Caenorhabditis auriculariae]
MEQISDYIGLNNTSNCIDTQESLYKQSLHQQAQVVVVNVPHMCMRTLFRSASRSVVPPAATSFPCLCPHRHERKKMRDRFNEFQSRVTDRFDEVELATPRPMSAADNMDRRLDEIRSAIETVRSEIEALRRKQQHILALTVADPRDKDVLEEQIGTIRRRTGDLRKLVRETEDEFFEFSRNAHSTAEVRIRKNQIELLKKKLTDLIYLFNDTHSDYRSRVSVRVRKQLQACGEDVSEAEIERILESNGSEQIFFREVNPLSVSGRAAMEDVKQRHNEIVELEKSVAMLQEIFQDMQHLTEEQGEMVNRIETNVEDTKGHVEQGARNVKTAVEYKKSAMRKKICVITILILIVLILIVVAIILAVVLSGNKK